MTTFNVQGDVPDARLEDVFIAIMGITEAGKSTFISNFVGDQVVIGHSMDSCRLFSEGDSRHDATNSNRHQRGQHISFHV